MGSELVGLCGDQVDARPPVVTASCCSTVTCSDPGAS